MRKDYEACIGIKGECTVLTNYVDNRFFAEGYKSMSFNGTFRMVTVGNLKPAKNYGYLIDAFRLLPKGVHLDIYGDGPLRQQLQAEINKHKLNIRLCGLNNNIHEVLRKYDLFVMSSVVEGHPVALLEAMASGMPAIVSDIPVLREATKNSGLYFELENINDFVKKVTAIANHEVDLDVYAKCNHDIIRREGGKEKYMEHLTSLYNRYKGQTNVNAVINPAPTYLPAFNLQTS